jgi:hypothetical protein
MKKKEPIMRTRMTQISELLDLSQAKFSLSLGKSRGYIKNIRDEIGSNVLYKILTEYPQINILWILTGQGQILLSESQNPDDQRLAQELNFAKDRIKQLEKENKELIFENGKLTGKLESFMGTENFKAG